MEWRQLILFCIGGLALLSACDSGNYNGNANGENTNIDSYQPTSNSDTEEPVKEYVSSIASRDVWQNPRVVINKLGDLTGKVIADIGAGQGYFSSYIANHSDIEKVIAIDIDKEAIQFIENIKITFEEQVRNKIETRLVEPYDANLKDNEVDVALIVNTYVYFENPLDYLRRLRRGIRPDGKVVIVDFKKRKTPKGPPMDYRVAIGEVEQTLLRAGYVDIDSDDQTLDYQYIITARPGLDQ
jgi:ubiquinone/menaquinone biosynthesis C-methylase UbiE